MEAKEMWKLLESGNYLEFVDPSNSKKTVLAGNMMLMHCFNNFPVDTVPYQSADLNLMITDMLNIGDDWYISND